jgi:hypothetical protein
MVSNSAADIGKLEHAYRSGRAYSLHRCSLRSADTNSFAASGLWYPLQNPKAAICC